jgi:hypothetical protein
MKSIALVAALAAVVLAGCATQATTTSTASTSVGKHLVYRDATGNVIRQFDYPDDALCRRVEAIAGGTARCQTEPITGLQAHATLRYNPPGVLVEGHYVDMARCQTDTGTLGPGVQLINPCR